LELHHITEAIKLSSYFGTAPKQQSLDECEVPPEVFRGGIERLAEFARPFAECLARREQRDHARTYLAGLVSDLKHKTAESIVLVQRKWGKRGCSLS
jgi:hypothetical protein